MAGLGVFSQARQDVAAQGGDQSLAMPKITELIMRGNAQAQGESMARDLSDKHTDALKKITFTLKPNPSGGEPLVSIKDAPLSAINQTHEDEVGKALTEPTKAVERKLTEPTQEQQVALERMYTANDATYGKRLPRPTDVDELLSTPEGIQELTFALGGNKDHAKRYAKEVKDPSKRAEIAATARRKLIEMHASVFKESKVALDESQDIDQNARAEANAKLQQAQEGRLVREQRLRELDRASKQENVVQYGSAQEFVENTEQKFAEIGGLTAADRKSLFNTYVKERADYLAKRANDLRGSTGTNLIEGYEDTPEAIQQFAVDNVGVPNPTQYELNYFAKIGKGLLEGKSDRQRKENSEIAKAARDEALAVRSVVAQERAAGEVARKNRNEERAEDREARLARERAVGPIARRIEELSDQIARNSVAAGSDPRKRAAIDEVNSGLMTELAAKREELGQFITFADQQEYDDLIASYMAEGKSRSEALVLIAADGVRLRRANFSGAKAKGQ